MKPQDFAAHRPPLALEEFFAGRGQAWGLFQDRFGTVRKQFSATTEGHWDPQAARLELAEDFVYDDGSTESRVWDIHKLDDARYTATTDGLVGEARIEARGNAVNLRYRLKLPMGGRRVALDFDDWMFRQSDDLVIDRAAVSKFGILLGTATICFQREAVATAAAAQ
jgi:hypothetical protein